MTRQNPIESFYPILLDSLMPSIPAGFGSRDTLSYQLHPVPTRRPHFELAAFVMKQDSYVKFASLPLMPLPLDHLRKYPRRGFSGIRDQSNFHFRFPLSVVQIRFNRPGQSLLELRASQPRVATPKVW